MIRVGGPTGGTIGLFTHDSANPLRSINMTSEQRAEIHVELITDNLDVLNSPRDQRALGRNVNHARLTSGAQNRQSGRRQSSPSMNLHRQ
jgi:hypothetical protein